ncbi:LPS export ABC transporter periplasmic protein LptC, partial [Fusobacterium sp.]
GPINIKQNGVVIDTANAIYKYSDALVHMNSQVDFKDDKGMVGKVSRAIYDSKNAILKGYDFDMKEPTRSAKSAEIQYHTNDNKLELIKNVYLVSDGNSIKTQNLIYDTKTSDIELKTASEINYDKYLIKSSSGKVNNKLGDIFVKNVHIISDDKSEFSANTTNGNINKGPIHFTGDVKSTVYDSNGEKTNFDGEMLDLYLEKTGDNYKAKKLIMNKPGIFTQLNRKLETDNLEADLTKNIVYLKNRPTLTVDNGAKGDTIGKADNAKALIDTKVLYLDGNVYVKDVNEKKEETVMTSERAEIKDNVASAYDKVKVTNKGSVLTANEGHYDMNTKKVRLKGNVHVDYLTGKGVGK